jgi:hemolysin D
MWASFGKLDLVATAEGKLVPQTYLKIVQPAEGGIVKEILVEEGDTVEQGPVLMRIDANLAQADTRIVENDINQRELRLRRIDAELSDQPIAIRNTDDSVQFTQIEAQYRSNQQAYQDALAQERSVIAAAGTQSPSGGCGQGCGHAHSRHGGQPWRHPHAPCADQRTATSGSDGEK